VVIFQKIHFRSDARVLKEVELILKGTMENDILDVLEDIG
jgi:hypothetical protein